ncbi:MAG: hypothetical protein IPK60_18300 [Sandaracinaceae bacterium]|nr:hypothetical protein [Sandaracinaceae bacterium]
MLWACRSILAVGVCIVLSACSGTEGSPGMDGGVSDAAAVRDATLVDTGVYTPGEPITADDRTWTWVDFPDTHCMDGSETGLGIYLNGASDNVLIYLEGGGACFNDATCDSVANPNGYGRDDFAAPTSGALSDTDATNPFRTWSKVFIPYCTGDIFAGANASGFGGRMHMGYLNMGEYLNRLVPTFGESERVVLSGSSAGGFGATYNYDRTQRAFGDTRVDLLDDSAPLFSSAYLKPCLQNTLRTTWNLDSTLPRDCTECFEEAGLSNFASYLLNKYSDRRMALISSNRDSVIRYFYGFGFSATCNATEEFSGEQYTDALDELRDVTLASRSNFSTYYLNSAQHVWLMNSPGTVQSGSPSVTLEDWLTSWLYTTMTVSNVAP